MEKFYSYFFTRQDIFPEYQLVQTAHAALELGHRLTKEQVKNLHFACCGVEDLIELKRVAQDLDMLGHKYVSFYEPDLRGELTSIGVYPIADSARGVLRDHKLLRFGTDSF
jgi:hypothetical protein